MRAAMARATYHNFLQVETLSLTLNSVTLAIGNCIDSESGIYVSDSRALLDRGLKPTTNIQSRPNGDRGMPRDIP